MDCDLDGSRETPRIPPTKAAFHDCRAAPGCVLRDEPRARTASAGLTRPSELYPAHRHNVSNASGTHQLVSGWLVLWFSRSMQFSTSPGDLITGETKIHKEMPPGPGRRFPILPAR